MRCKTVLNFVRSRDCTEQHMPLRVPTASLPRPRGGSGHSSMFLVGPPWEGAGRRREESADPPPPSTFCLQGTTAVTRLRFADVEYVSSGLLILNPVPGVTMRTPRVQTSESSGRTLCSWVPSSRAWQEGSGVRLAEFQGLLPSRGLVLYNPTCLAHGWGFYMKK